MQQKAVSNVLAVIAPARAPAAPRPVPQAEPERETGVTATSAAPIAPAAGEPVKQ
jgi:hypothetical protein